MRLYHHFQESKHFKNFVKKNLHLHLSEVIPIEVIYPDWDNLSRFGDILSLLYVTIQEQWTDLNEGETTRGKNMVET